MRADRDTLVFPISETSPAWVPFERYMVEYIAYVSIAIALAVTSSFLTVSLTRSTDFETRKNVLFERSRGGHRVSTADLGVEGKPRKVMVSFDELLY